MAPTAKEQLAEAKRRARAQLKAIAEIERRTSAPRSSYEAHKDRAAKRQAELSESGRDIGPLPDVVDAQRREACRFDLRLYCETYFPATFVLEWSNDHLETIKAIQDAALRGELYFFAMPRGSGKTSLVEVAALWAISYGHQLFVAIIGSDEPHAKTMLESIKIESETNERLLADFPEIFFPIHALERIHNRASGQLYKGKPTYIKWKEDEVQFPTMPGSAASGAIIRVKGITCGIRGMKSKRACDGKAVRPTFVLLDDPQTDESAKSPKQVDEREALIAGAVLGLAGPGKKIAGLATVTCIARDDLAERLLNRERHPAFQGRLFKMVYAWPTRQDLWDEYAELRKRGQRQGRGTAEADEFYRVNQEAMDEGSRVAWPARKSDDELSAIQHAWNLRIDRGEAAFFAEFQNAPLEDKTTSDAMTPADVTAAVRNVPRWIVPRGFETLTAFVDVQATLLYWAVVAWGHKLRGHVVAYGAYPDQGRPYFTLRDARQTLQHTLGIQDESAAIHAGLEAVHEDLLGRQFAREDDDAILQVALSLVDINWAQQQGTVLDFCRRSKWGPRVLPAKGRFIGASSMKGISDTKPDRGERVGAQWRTSTIQRQRHVLFDRNFWYSLVSGRIKLPEGDPQGLTIHAGEHNLLADHLGGNRPVLTMSRERTVNEWKLIPGREDHWADCIVGAAVAASYTGISAVGVEGAPVPEERRRVDVDEVRRRMMDQYGQG
jgi:hypothetical protein